MGALCDKTIRQLADGFSFMGYNQGDENTSDYTVPRYADWCFWQ